MARGEYGTLKRTGVLLALAGFCLYLPTLFQGFISDDNIYLAFKNKFLRNSSWGDWYQAFTGRTNPWEYLPLRDLSYWLDFRLYEYEGMGFHVTNLIWYALAALAAGLLFRELILLCRPGWSDRATALAWCGAALFLVHPVHVEAAAWVASRKDLMSGCFALLSAFVLTRNIRSQHWSFGGSVLAALFLLAACFSKAAGVAMVLFEVVLILSCWRRASDRRDTLSGTRITIVRKVAPLVLLCSVAAMSVYVSMKVGTETGIRSGNMVPFADVIERASRILAAFLKLLAWPHPLGLYHDVYAQGAWHWIASGFVAIAALTALFALWLQPTLWAFGVILLLAPCLVYLQLTPFGTWSLASERFLFMPVAGLVLIVIELYGRLSMRRAMVVVFVLFLPCAWLTWQRVNEWNEDAPKPLLAYDYAREPLFHNAIRDRVFTLSAKGHYDEAKRIAENAGRPWAVAALDAVIDVAKGYGNDSMFAAIKAASMQTDTSAVNEDDDLDKRKDQPRDIAAFCRAMPRLRETLAAGWAALPQEPDLTYGNLLGSISREVNERYAFFEQRNCPAPTQKPSQ